MGVFNVTINKADKTVRIENRRRVKEVRPEVAIALNAEDERPLKIEVKPLIVDEKIRGKVDARISRKS